MAKSIVISETAHKKLKEAAGSYSIKDYVEFLITYASILDLKYQDFGGGDLTNKELMEGIQKRLTSRHNTLIGFIKAQDTLIAKGFETIKKRDEETLRLLISSISNKKV